MIKLFTLSLMLFSLNALANITGPVNGAQKSLDFYSSLWNCSNKQLFDTYLGQSSKGDSCDLALSGGKKSLSEYEYTNLLDNHIKARENIINFISSLEQKAKLSNLLADVRELMNANITQEKIVRVSSLSIEQKKIIEMLYSQIK